MLLLLLLGVGLQPVAADMVIFGEYYVPADTECMESLSSLYYSVKWEGYSGYKSVCKSKTVAVALYSAMYKYCHPVDLDVNQEVMNGICQKRLEIDAIKITSLAKNLTTEAIAALPVYSYKEMKKKTNVTEAFLPNEAYYKYYFAPEHADDRDTRRTTGYALSHYGFWGFVLLVGMLQNLIRHIVNHRRGYVYTDAEGTGRMASSRSTPAVFRPVVAAYAWVRKHVLVPSPVGSYRSRRLFGCTIPTRMESFIVYSYWILSIILNSADFKAAGPGPTYKSSAAAISHYVAERSGIFCYANIPLIWIFAGRNNIFIPLTGWNFGTFNIFHRHISRIATLQAIVHTVTFIMYYYLNDKVKSKLDVNMKKLWMKLGIAAMAAMIFIITFSFGFFRVRYYDLFLLTHIVLSCLLLVFLFYHTAHYASDVWNYPLLMPAVGIWSFDRLMRLVRQLYCNLHVSLNRQKTVHQTRTTVSYDAQVNLLHFDVVPGNKNLLVGPGQHYYLYQPLRILGWENHPFTLADCTREPESTGGDLHLHFWVRPYDGWTKRVRCECEKAAAASSSSDARISTGLLLEGPYGHSEPLHAFDEVLFIVGGSGMATVLLYIKDYLERLQPSTADGRVRTRTRHLTLVWADRSELHMRRTLAQALQQAVGRSDIQVELYLTGAPETAPTTTPLKTSALGEKEVQIQTSSSGSSRNDCDEKNDEKHNDSSSNASSPIEVSKMYHGRPDVAAIVGKAAAGVRGTDSRLAIMVCGTDSLSDATRKAVADNMENTRDSIEFFQESFGW